MILYSNLAKSASKQLKSLLDHNIFVKIKLSGMFKFLFSCLFTFILFLVMVYYIQIVVMDSPLLNLFFLHRKLITLFL